MYSIIVILTVILIIMSCDKIRKIMNQCVLKEKSEFALHRYWDKNQKSISIINFIFFLTVLSLIFHKAFETYQWGYSYFVSIGMLYIFLISYFICYMFLQYNMDIVILNDGIGLNGYKIKWNTLSCIHRKGDKIIIYYCKKKIDRKNRNRVIIGKYNEIVYKFIRDKMQDVC